MKYVPILIVFLSFTIIQINAQNKKTLNILKTQKAPKIDGVLDDSVWINATDAATDFTQFRPEMGVVEKPHQKNIVKMAYDDNAIYVGAYLKDNPEDIQKQLTSRDNFGQSDFFGVILNPNNDAQNDIEFFVFSSGTQADALASPNIPDQEDFGWNAVWDSAVKIVEDGWIVEMKIPYRALRFSNDEVQTWGIQFHRRFRLDNSQYSWNPIDRTKGYSGIYHGELKGIKNIKPPTRLSFYPFVSVISESTEGETDNNFNVGLDVKYGITENFTLDATLIPDFSQAAFDNRSLNLGPFEQTFSEQRQFFKEGVDLFNKGDMFFSRRIGNAPVDYEDLEDELIDNDNTKEDIVNNPDQVKTLNALKFSGRTKKGLGIGFFNAITEKTQAKIKRTDYIRNPVSQNITDSIITYRDRVTESLANYNILVVDQQFRKNSSVSLINTNVTRDGKFRDANVTGALFNIIDKNNKYNYNGEVKMSLLNLEEGAKTGYSSKIEFGKVSGNYRYNIGHELADRKFDINDLGLQLRNNYNNLYGEVSYRIFEPTEKLNNLRIRLTAKYSNLLNPGRYTGNRIRLRISAQNKKLMWFGTNFHTRIGKQHDYFDPRDTENNRFFTYKNLVTNTVWVETNKNKVFSIEANLGAATLLDKERDLFGRWFELEPTVRLNDKLRISYEYEYDRNKGGRGWVDTNDSGDIIYGQRDQLEIENSLSASYNFNPLNALTLTFRNYWTTVDYDYDLFTLLDNGKLTTASGFNIENIDFDPNINFSTWNLDLRYSWQFAPGSQIIALYRNQLFNEDTASKDRYFKSLDTLFDQPIDHTFSLRFIYFIDYNELKSVLK
ncbi:DUF5916 domain-containing protein [Flavivirga eckloniae]|uniref:Protein with DOMON-like ligand-binding domain protein n=1 Tax=Flavivirga eckloniae TaxID=1803846 RepID=A0A2K9PLT8_9FLAO|nr:DUF5916 domain-containing protein [Flavivirga eckloniae]AUP77808.1 protein with DOMON-like ligand-binding domain protein [Flavivirga eckloniae]